MDGSWGNYLHPKGNSAIRSLTKSVLGSSPGGANFALPVVYVDSLAEVRNLSGFAGQISVLG